MAVAQKGASLEELVRAYFARQGFFALRGVSYRFDEEEITDIDVWLYGRQTASVRTRTVVDVKDKRSPKAFERVLWTRGLQLAIGADRAVVATTETSPKVVAFAQQQKVALLSKGFLERLSKNLDTAGRLSTEDLNTSVNLYSSHKQDGDWIRVLSNAKSAVVSLSGFPAFNKVISSFRFFAERTETRPHHREQAIRCAYLCAALACIALDSALERSQYEDSGTKYQNIMTGVTYGDSGDGRVQSSISRVLRVIAGGMENGKVIARQAEDSFEAIFKEVRADIIAEYFVREQNSSYLFSVAKELDAAAFAIKLPVGATLTIEARSIVGIFSDFVGTNRRSLIGQNTDAGSPSPHPRVAETKQTRLYSEQASTIADAMEVERPDLGNQSQSHEPADKSSTNLGSDLAGGIEATEAEKESAAQKTPLPEQRSENADPPSEPHQGSKSETESQKRLI